jgi:prevent-host-death family protein
MRTIQVREAKAKLSAIIADAEDGRPTVITRHGRPVAILAPVEDARRIYPPRSFADLLLTIPGGLDFERDPTPLRDLEL